MISSPLTPGFYSRSNLLLAERAQEDRVAVAERWQEEASAAAVEGNPRRARHVEDMIGHLIYGAP